MTQTVQSSNELIDELIGRYFGVGPDAMASLAHGDEQVRLRYPFGLPLPADPLDGLDVLIRRVAAMCLVMRKHPGASVSLVTECQARAAGWPAAKVANLSIVLAWALFIGTEPCSAMPVLLAADETTRGGVNPLLRVDRRLPAMDKLLAALRRGWRLDAMRHERGGSAPNRQTATAGEGRKLVVLSDLIEDWFGVDAAAVELPSDGWPPRLDGRNARAVGVLAWIATEAVEMYRVLGEERIMAVRLKTDRDAALAGEPGASAANLAFLLAAAGNHAAGVTVCFLPPRPDDAAALVEAGRRIESGHRQAAADLHAQTVQVLELTDLAARGYIHIGRYAAERVARRLFDKASGEAVARTRQLADEAAR